MKVVVDGSDIDEYGHKNYKAYPRLFEPAQDAFMNERGIGFAAINSLDGLARRDDKAVKQISLLLEGRDHLKQYLSADTKVALDYYRFIPLEKTADFNRRSLPFEADGGSKPPLAPLENSFLTG